VSDVDYIMQIIQSVQYLFDNNCNDLIVLFEPPSNVINILHRNIVMTRALKILVNPHNVLMGQLLQVRHFLSNLMKDALALRDLLQTNDSAGLLAFSLVGRAVSSAVYL